MEKRNKLLELYNMAQEGSKSPRPAGRHVEEWAETFVERIQITSLELEEALIREEEWGDEVGNFAKWKVGRCGEHLYTKLTCLYRHAKESTGIVCVWNSAGCPGVSEARIRARVGKWIFFLFRMKTNKTMRFAIVPVSHWSGVHDVPNWACGGVFCCLGT